MARARTHADVRMTYGRGTSKGSGYSPLDAELNRTQGFPQHDAMLALAGVIGEDRESADDEGAQKRESHALVKRHRSRIHGRRDAFDAGASERMHRLEEAFVERSSQAASSQLRLYNVQAVRQRATAGRH